MSSTCQFFGLTAFQAWAVRVDGPPLAGDEGRGGVFSVQLTHHAGLIHPLQVVVEQVGVPGTLEEKFYYVNLSKKSTNLFSLWTLTGSSALARPQCRKNSQPLCPFRKKSHCLSFKDAVHNTAYIDTTPATKTNPSSLIILMLPETSIFHGISLLGRRQVP